MITVDKIVIVVEPDESPDLSYLEDEGRYSDVPPAQAAKYREQDRARLASYGDSWYMLGIRAEARITIWSGGVGMTQKISSGGLWGIESDSGEKYFRQVAKEEYKALVGLLKEMNAKKIPPFKDVNTDALIRF